MHDVSVSICAQLQLLCHMSSNATLLAEQSGHKAWGPTTANSECLSLPTLDDYGVSMPSLAMALRAHDALQQRVCMCRQQWVRSFETLSTWRLVAERCLAPQFRRTLESKCSERKCNTHRRGDHACATTATTRRDEMRAGAANAVRWALICGRDCPQHDSNQTTVQRQDCLLRCRRKEGACKMRNCCQRRRRTPNAQRTLRVHFAGSKGHAMLEACGICELGGHATMHCATKAARKHCPYNSLT